MFSLEARVAAIVAPVGRIDPQSQAALRNNDSHDRTARLEFRSGRHPVAGGTGHRRRRARLCCRGCASAIRETVSGHSIESMRALRAGVARALSGAQPRSDLPAPPRAQGSVRRGGPCGVARRRGARGVFQRAQSRRVLRRRAAGARSRLRARYRLFALSNGNADLRALRHRRICSPATSRAIAAGAAKPDARIFARAARAWPASSAAQVLHIGDDPLADVVGATHAGMQAVWLNRDAREWPAAVRAAAAHHFDARGNYVAPMRCTARLAAYDVDC